MRFIVMFVTAVCVLFLIIAGYLDLNRVICCNLNVSIPTGLSLLLPGARFSKVPETFRARKAKEKSRTLRLQSCFICIILI